MKTPAWLERSICVTLQEVGLAQYGGRAGVRDEERLGASLESPRNSFASGRRSPPALAAAYAAGIILNHPFLDGNKRTGFMAAAAFLELNGQEFFATEVDAVIQTLALAAGELDEAGYAAWLKKNSRRARRTGR